MFWVKVRVITIFTLFTNHFCACSKVVFFVFWFQPFFVEGTLLFRRGQNLPSLVKKVKTKKTKLFWKWRDKLRNLGTCPLLPPEYFSIEITLLKVQSIPSALENSTSFGRITAQLSQVLVPAFFDQPTSLGKSSSPLSQVSIPAALEQNLSI